MAAGTDWSQRENKLIVADYFAMLEAEAAGREFNKSAHNETLREQLDARSRASVEFKHQNISAILQQMGIPFVDGYKPRANFQNFLADAVAQYVADHPEIPRWLETATKQVPSPELFRQYADASRIVAPPEPLVREKPREAGDWTSPMFYDFAEQEDRNRQLGSRGEEFVVETERRRLMHGRREDLAGAVKWTSRERGDGLGYDVESFELNGRPIFIEVKTTTWGIRRPFMLSRNEVRVSERLDDDYRLYRVFKFSADPRLFILVGAVTRRCSLEAATFLARVD